MSSGSVGLPAQARAGPQNCGATQRPARSIRQRSDHAARSLEHATARRQASTKPSRWCPRSPASRVRALNVIIDVRPDWSAELTDVVNARQSVWIRPRFASEQVHVLRCTTPPGLADRPALLEVLRCVGPRSGLERVKPGEIGRAVGRPRFPDGVSRLSSRHLDQDASTGTLSREAAGLEPPPDRALAHAEGGGGLRDCQHVTHVTHVTGSMSDVPPHVNGAVALSVDLLRWTRRPAAMNPDRL